MPVEIFVNSTEVLTLDQFRTRVLSKVDPSDPRTLELIAKDLKSLANDKSLMARQISKDLSSWSAPTFGMYSAQSCILDRFGPFTVRANLWPSAISTKGERSALSYNAYHNHNFSFATTNLYGPGYTTDLYELEDCNRAIEVGDKVDLRPFGEKVLGSDVVVIYRKTVDVHAQIPPTKASASLNLILSDDDVISSDQFYFDPGRGIVIGMVENVVAKRISALELGRFLASGLSREALAVMASNSPCRRTRSLCQILSRDR